MPPCQCALALRNVPATRLRTKADLLACLMLARRQLELNPCQDLDLRNLSARVGISPYHFVRLFSSTFSEPPIAYSIRLRLEKSRGLLATSSEPIWKISLECGFTSQASFSRSFKKRFGISPTQCRRGL